MLLSSASITSRNILKVFIACIILYLVIFLSPIERVARIVHLGWPSELTPLPRAQCSSVLTRMTEGRWVKLSQPRSDSKQQLQQLQYFLHNARQQHFLPYDLQRLDEKCGNVTFEGWSGKMNNLLWFRALCNPDGDTPCCYGNRCEARREEDCRCENCYDLRQRIHAEFASWLPADPTCQIHLFRGEDDTCRLLRNMTIYIIGDSFLRHVYISLLALLRSNTYHGPLYEYSPQGMIHACDRNFVFLRMCIRWIDRETRECGNSVKLKFLEYVLADQSTQILETIQELRETPNSVVILGLGIHDDFNFTAVSEKLLHPLLAHLTNSRWPEVVWASTHAPGLLKSPRIPSQSMTSIARYNAKVKAILSFKSVTIFDTFPLTKQVTSFDGAHFGRGVNDMKVQILLNYILEKQDKYNLDIEHNFNKTL